MSALYDNGREAILSGQIDWTSDTIKAAAVDTSSYTVAIDTDTNLSDVPGGAIVATSNALTGCTADAGVADCDDFTFTAVTGDEISALVFYHDTGTLSTSQLIAYVDAGPFTPNGADITIRIDSGSNRLFKL